VLFNPDISIPLGKDFNALSLNPFAIAGYLPPGPTDLNMTFAPEADELGTVQFRGAKDTHRQLVNGKELDE